MERRSLFPSSEYRDFEYADTARSYIGFRTVQDYMGTQVTGNCEKSRAKKLELLTNYYINLTN
jgi:hypothetical protein